MDIATLTGLALSTLISEDLATIAAGLLVRGQHLPASHAVAACVTGVCEKTMPARSPRIEKSDAVIVFK